MIPEAEKSFHDFLASHGHPLDTSINHDSSGFHYFKCPNGSSTDARYKFFPDGIPSGYFKCWHCNIDKDFCSKQKHEVSLQEWQAHVKHMTEFKKQNEIEIQQKHMVATREAQRIWGLVATEENVSEHSYLRLKHVRSYGLRMLTQDVAYEVYPKQFNEDGNKKIHKAYQGNLLVPCYNASNELVNLESIYLDRKTNRYQKRPLSGGQRLGAYYLIGEAIDSPKVILVAEGYSTAATAYEATGYPTAITFNCGNIVNVTNLLREKYPKNRLMILADDDRWHDDPALKHAGLKAAEKACVSVKNATYLQANFSVLGLSEEELAKKKPTDHNDLFGMILENGLNREAALLEIRQQIQQHLIQGNCMTDNAAEQTNNSQSNEKKPKDSEALLRLIDESELEFEFFHDEQQDTFCKFRSINTGVYEIRRLDEKTFKIYLSYIFRREFKKTIADTSLKEALTELGGRALHDGKKEKVFLRVGELNNKIYIDLCDDHWRVIEVSAEGWKILESKNIPIRFERNHNMKPLPEPLITGNISLLWDLINIPQDDQCLVLAFVLDCFRYNTQFTILTLLGQQGSGKSTTQEILRDLIDPSICNLRTAPRKPDDLVTEAKRNHLLSYNNVSSLSNEMHDDFCNISTGGGFSTRKLFTDNDQIVFNIARPVIINGINNFIRRPDFLDRAVIVELPQMDDRVSDEQLKSKAKKSLPSIFGGLLDLMVNVLKILPTISLPPKPPRMVDYTILGIAVEQTMNLPENMFLNQYQKNRNEAQESVIESCPVILALIDFIEQQPEKFWRGRPTELLDILTNLKNPSLKTSWPETARAMGDALKRYEIPLKQFEIEIVDESKSSGKRNRKGKYYRISKTHTQRAQHTHHDEKTNNDGVYEAKEDVHVPDDNSGHVHTSSTNVHTQKKPENIDGAYVFNSTSVHSARCAHDFLIQNNDSKADDSILI